jgi:hypothetical protein
MNSLFLVLPVVALTAACTQLPSASEVSASLEKRATERWALLIKGDLAGAYQYLSPATRDVLPFENYRGSIKLGLWRSVEINKVVCTSDVLCSVQLNMHYSYKPKGSPVYDGTRALSETWKKDGGQWWHIPE